jgi:hypothetical protein
MRKVGFFFILTILLTSTIGLSVARFQQPELHNDSTQRKTIVDFEADLMRPIKVADSSAILLVGNVIFEHNQSTITCDSAIRFGEKLMKCYGNVVVNKATTYIYGDSAEYSGISNVAKIFSPLIKMVDKDVTMYCYNLSFNTLTNIGRFFGTATISQRDNLMEAQSGFYNTETKVLTFRGNVQMENPDYKICTDSMTYNTETQVTNFFTRAHIWSKDSNFLSARRGIYYRTKDLYDFFDDSYICTKNQEIWADSMVYNAREEESALSKNVQIYDSLYQSLLFGDLGRYWGKTSKAFMTQNPSMIIIDRRQVRDAEKLDSIYFRYDSLYVKADTMFMFTVQYKDAIFVEDSLEDDIVPEAFGDPIDEEKTEMSETSNQEDVDNSVTADSTSVSVPDSLPAEKVLTAKDLKKIEKERKRLEKKERREAKQLARRKIIEEKAKIKAEKIKIRNEKRLARKAKKNNKPTIEDVVPEHLLAPDTVENAPIAVVKDEIEDLNEIPQDSMVRLFKAYFNVRTFRSDFQSRCDSLVGYFTDSTMRMFKDPVIWSGENQISAERIDIFSKNNHLDKMIFDVDPMMIEQVNDSLYNQITGKYMEAHFKNNDVKTLYVDGNAQTYYYLEEGDSTEATEVIGFLVADCSNIRFDFEDNSIYEIVWIGNPVYSIYPMDKIPETQPQTMKNFKWRGQERPKDKNEVFTRTIRESNRKYVHTLEQPKFPITEAINRHKEQLLRVNSWTDHNPSY